MVPGKFLLWAQTYLVTTPLGTPSCGLESGPRTYCSSGDGFLGASSARAVKVKIVRHAKATAVVLEIMPSIPARQHWRLAPRAGGWYTRRVRLRHGDSISSHLAGPVCLASPGRHDAGVR